MIWLKNELGDSRNKNKNRTPLVKSYSEIVGIPTISEKNPFFYDKMDEYDKATFRGL